MYTFDQCAVLFAFHRLHHRSLETDRVSRLKMKLFRHGQRSGPGLKARPALVMFTGFVFFWEKTRDLKMLGGTML